MATPCTADTILGLVRVVAGPDRGPRIRIDSRLLDEGGLDSFGLLSLVVEIETTFSISLSTADLTARNFHCVRDIVALVERHLCP